MGVVSEGCPAREGVYDRIGSRTRPLGYPPFISSQPEAIAWKNLIFLQERRGRQKGLLEPSDIRPYSLSDLYGGPVSRMALRGP
jgi:hypothetical protein